MLSLYFFIDPSATAFFPKCPFLSFTGIYCPGCGSQRAIHHILQGQIITGIRHNYMFLLVTVVLGYQAVIFVITKFGTKTYNNLLHKSKMTNTILVLVILFWILRNIPYFPFTELAP
ncbi:DUF2752 domain-containing protein [Winogradskyella sp. F6397]|uniref:DUF2752 domain-containing protein n=1 Tax=Winogradskyella marina TaxID=2785530 RepID=A0ABS0ELT4_9FLAO|nr:DUF2752 domain-containing protein [Winogradskyella marina]MBF8150537.1 DUF2752 domain-containing protein [Winogradskyella marina]